MVKEALGPQFEVFSRTRLCTVAALSEDGEEAYAHTLRGHTRTRPPSMCFHHEVESLLRGVDERIAREEVRRFVESAEAIERDRISYPRSLAVLRVRRRHQKGY
jgi:hypothetical protein